MTSGTGEHERSPTGLVYYRVKKQTYNNRKNKGQIIRIHWGKKTLVQKGMIKEGHV
jgi:hypothetical protein